MFFTIGERVRDGDGFVFDRNWIKKITARSALLARPKLFVAKKLSGNKIVIAPEGDSLLKTREVFLKSFKLINPSEKLSSGLKARIRHLGEKYSGKLFRRDRRWKFIFGKGVEGVAEGQFIVFYKGERLVGCGEIRLN
jgi:tRNA U34 2-thiouridine synthase MnmA/TrmU